MMLRRITKLHYHHRIFNGNSINNNQYRLLLQGALISTTTTTNSITKTTTRLFSNNRAVAGAMMLFSAAAIVEEAHARAFRIPPQRRYSFSARVLCSLSNAFLDYYDIPYKVVEFKSLKKETKSLVRNNMLMVDGELIDNSKDGRDVIDILIKKIHYDFAVGSETESNEEKKWRRWVDKHLINIQCINIYRSFSEALESLEYYLSQGSNYFQPSVGTFNFAARTASKYAGAAIVYYLSKRMKKLYEVTDERVALYKALEEWVDALDGQDFLGGTKPNLADLAVFGVLRQMRYLKSGRDMVEHTRIGDWYSRMEDAVGMSANTGRACSQINILTD